MRFHLRLRGRTADGVKCRADVSVSARSQKHLQRQTDEAARTAVWLADAPPHDPIPEGSHITIERVETI
jgi:hypothetical protein